MLADDLDQLYDDQFIETCAPWVIPYIGDLIGYQSVEGNCAGRRRSPRRSRQTPSRCAAAKARCWSWSNLRATSPDGARTPSSSSRCSATRST